MNQDLDLSSREEAAYWCSLLAEGPLDNSDREAFESWLEENSEHRAYFEQAVSMWVALPLPVDDSELFPQPAEPWQQTTLRMRAPQRHFVLTAICVLVVVMASGAGVHWLTAPKTFTSDIGRTETIALGDGTKVMLDANSQVRVKITGGERRVWLDKGRAQFQVSHDAHRPFSVVANGHAVVALGTRFTVDRIGRSLTVDLVEGRLAGFESEAGFRTADAHSRFADTANYTFVGGQRLQWRGDGGRATLSSISVDDATAWTTGRLVFVDAPLRDAIETVNRYTSKPLEVEDGVRSDLRVSGIYRAGDINAFLLGVSTTTRLKAKNVGGVWILQNPE